VSNQVDKINPLRDWDVENMRPGFAQQKVIGERTQWAVEKFSIARDNVIAISAYEKYNLGGLVEQMIDVVPTEKKLGLLNQVEEEVVTEKAQETAVKSVAEYLKSLYKELKPYIPDIIAAIKFIFKMLKKN
jgi:predicted GTPase